MKSLRVIAFALAVTALVAPAQAADRFVTVTGEASVNAAPDLAVIRVGVASNAKTSTRPGWRCRRNTSQAHRAFPSWSASS